MLRGVSIGLLAVALVLAACAPSAIAASQPGADIPGLSQYTEMLPSAGGAGTVPSSAASQRLRPGVQAELHRLGGGTATSLRVIATSAAFGALQAKRPSRADVQRLAAGGDVGLAAAVKGSLGHGSVLAVVLALVLSGAAAARRGRNSA